MRSVAGLIAAVLVAQAPSGRINVRWYRSEVQLETEGEAGDDFRTLAQDCAIVTCGGTAYDAPIDVTICPRPRAPCKECPVVCGRIECRKEYPGYQNPAVEFAACMAGPGFPQTHLCRFLDHDRDGDVDLRDWAVLTREP